MRQIQNLNITEIDSTKKIKSQVYKKNKYLLNLNAYKTNYLRIIKVTLEREPLRAL